MRNNKIVIVDYGVGNLASLINLLGKFEFEITISNKKNVLKNADCLILPGVGNFTEAIRNLVISKSKNISEDIGSSASIYGMKSFGLFIALKAKRNVYCFERNRYVLISQM